MNSQLIHPNISASENISMPEVNNWNVQNIQHINNSNNALFKQIGEMNMENHTSEIDINKIYSNYQVSQQWIPYECNSDGVPYSYYDLTKLNLTPSDYMVKTEANANNYFYSSQTSPSKSCHYHVNNHLEEKIEQSNSYGYIDNYQTPYQFFTSSSNTEIITLPNDYYMTSYSKLGETVIGQKTDSLSHSNIRHKAVYDMEEISTSSNCASSKNYFYYNLSIPSPLIESNQYTYLYDKCWDFGRKTPYEAYNYHYYRYNDDLKYPNQKYDYQNKLNNNLHTDHAFSPPSQFELAENMLAIKDKRRGLDEHSTCMQQQNSNYLSSFNLSSSHNNTINICCYCGKSYSRPSTLKTHLRTHSGERPFSCHRCGKGFAQAANLMAHIRTHSGEKPFKCRVCRRHFSQSSSVTTHMRTHSGERPYRCSQCSKQFSDSSTLTKHIRTHSGEKPYQCTLCELKFSQSGNLSRHMKVHTNNTFDDNILFNNDPPITS